VAQCTNIPASPRWATSPALLRRAPGAGTTSLRPAIDSPNHPRPRRTLTARSPPYHTFHRRTQCKCAKIATAKRHPFPLSFLLSRTYAGAITPGRCLPSPNLEAAGWLARTIAAGCPGPTPGHTARGLPPAKCAIPTLLAGTSPRVAAQPLARLASLLSARLGVVRGLHAHVSDRRRGGAVRPYGDRLTSVNSLPPQAA